MKTNLWKMGMAVILAGSVLASCKKDSNVSPTGTSSAQAKMSFGLKADNSDVTLNSAGNLTTQASGSNAGVTWTAGIANISGFKLEAKRRGVEVEIKSNAIATVDIFAPVPALISAIIDTGTYREIEIKAMLAKTSGANIPLVLKGIFRSAGGATVPIELDFNDDAIIKAEAEGVVVDGTQDINTLVQLHLNKLLNGVSAADLDAAARTGGTILIGNGMNTGIYNRIRDNIGNSGGSGGFEKHGKG